MLRRNALEFTRKLRSLGRGELLFAVRAWGWAPLVEASLAMVGLRATRRWIERVFVPRTSHGGSPGGIEVDRARWLVDAVYRAHVVRGSCLPRSLLQYALLRRSGREVELVIGVASGKPLAAHAWVRAAGSSDTVAPYEPLSVSP